MSVIRSLRNRILLIPALVISFSTAIAQKADTLWLQKIDLSKVSQG